MRVAENKYAGDRDVVAVGHTRKRSLDLVVYQARAETRKVADQCPFYLRLPRRIIRSYSTRFGDMRILTEQRRESHE